MDILTSISLVIYPVEWSYRVSHIEIEFSNLLLRIEGPILFFDLWCLAASGGADICVSSTSSQKNDIGWPQQPLTEKVLKLNMIFHDPTPKKLYFKM